VISSGPLPTSKGIIRWDRCSPLCSASGVTSSYDALLDLFECLGNFLKRLEVYTTIPPIPVMMDLIIKIMV
ncbi:hypothetical protein BGY98DRAFT_1005532, partial [Russula aff. rugulosa BPL654]